MGSSQRVIVKSDANPDESYYKSGSTWYDLYDYEFTNPSWDETANFCIKALVSDYIPMVPDLECEGELSWPSVKAGEEVTGSFTVENIGDPGSLLDWEVSEWPDWGNWTFNPESGTGLEEGDTVTIDVEVVAPDEPETEFTGEVKIVNSEDPSDYCIIPVSLVTPVNQQVDIHPLFQRILERFPNAFPILRHLMGLIE